MNNDAADEWASSVITSPLYNMLDAFLLFKLKCCISTIGPHSVDLDVKQITMQ